MQEPIEYLPKISSIGLANRGAVVNEDENQGRYYPNLLAFVDRELMPYFDREVHHNYRNYIWCPKWWLHTEAIMRLNLLWDAWEGANLSKKADAKIAWLINYAHPIVEKLLAPSGPFRSCAGDKGHDPRANVRKPYTEMPPEGYFEAAPGATINPEPPENPAP